MEKIDTWTAFGGEYLKAIEVENNTDEYVIVGVSSKDEDDKTTLILKLERNELKKIFTCNKTNLKAVQAECPTGPKQAIGRVITFDKVKTQRPGTDEIVDGLRLKLVPENTNTAEDTTI